jgi:predicted PurR-regulated permease PerM
VIAILVVFPLLVVGAGLVQEASGLFERLQSGELDVRRSLLELRSSLPEWALNLLTQVESTRLADVVERFSTALMQGGQFIAGQILSIGQATLNFVLSVFVMLYLLFYILRDGGRLLVYIQRATPLPPEQQQVLASKFTATVRGTLKGDLVIAIIQGVLGGLLFWVLDLGTPILWGTVMAVLSMLPVVGTGFVWGPAAIYLLLTGSIGQGVAVLVYGALVISTVEYILRPLLVGNDVKMPSYVVLLSSLGGIATFGINGFVIGPLVAALFLAAWEMHLQTRGARQGAPPS